MFCFSGAPISEALLNRQILVTVIRDYAPVVAHVCLRLGASMKAARFANWKNHPVQFTEPNYAGSANRVSLNKAGAE
jgi:hypothetical protein